MSDPVYITPLGPNLYLDSEGRMHRASFPRSRLTHHPAVCCGPPKT